MQINRIRLAAALSLVLASPVMARQEGVAPPPRAPESPGAVVDPVVSEAEKIVGDAIAKIRALTTVSADIQQEVRMLGLRFQVSGRYLKAPGNRVYMLLQVSGLGNSDGTMLQVSNGDVLWDYKKVLETTDFRKRMLAPILEKLDDPDCDPELREQVLSRMGFVGPDALLVGLREAIELDQIDQTELDGRPMWLLRGRWKDRRSLNEPGEANPVPRLGPLPPYVPSLAALWIDKETGWLHRVELFGKSPSIVGREREYRELGPDGRPVGRAMVAGDQPPTEIRLTYSNVQLNPDLSSADFAWQPPADAQVYDETEAIVTDLTGQLAQRAAQRQAEEARRSGPVLPSIPVPLDPNAGSTPPPVETIAPPLQPR